MATGIYAQATLAATTLTDVFTMTTTAVVNITFCNKASTAATIRLALAAGATAAAGEYRFYDLPIESFGFRQYTGAAIQPGKHILAYASTANIDISIEGVE